MPTKNSRKEYAPDTYYHAYSRGVNKQTVFLDEQDYTVYLGYLQRYLSPNPAKRGNRQTVKSFAKDLDLLCYCLMPNHVHLLFYQREDDRALAALLQRVFTSYSMYFNKKYKRVGPVFQSRYLASRISDEPYLYHISRYIHRNPKSWRRYEFSSLRYYTGDAQADWVKPKRVLELFGDNSKKYLDFVADTNKSHEKDITNYMAHE